MRPASIITWLYACQPGSRAHSASIGPVPPWATTLAAASSVMAASSSATHCSSSVGGSNAFQSVFVAGVIVFSISSLIDTSGVNDGLFAPPSCPSAGAPSSRTATAAERVFIARGPRTEKCRDRLVVVLITSLLLKPDSHSIGLPVRTIKSQKPTRQRTRAVEQAQPALCYKDATLGSRAEAGGGGVMLGSFRSAAIAAAALCSAHVLAQDGEERAQDAFDRTPQDCILASRIDRTEVIDDNTIIFHMRGRQAYVN